MASILAIAVVNYASTALLAEHLVASQDSAREMGMDPIVVVCDNFSTDTEREQVRSLCVLRGWDLVENPDNPGFGDGANVAMSRAFHLGASEVLLLNPDARIDGKSLRTLHDVVPVGRMAILAPVIRTVDGRVWFNGADLYLGDGETRGRAKRAEHVDADTTPWLTGACLYFTREAFNATGGFAPGYFLYWEDVDLSWRAARMEIQLVTVAGAEAVHDAGGTQNRTGSRGKSRTYYFYNSRNRLVFAARNLDAVRMREWLRHTPSVTWRILMRGGRAQLIRDPGVAWAAFRGAVEGRRAVRRALAARD